MDSETLEDKKSEEKAAPVEEERNEEEDKREEGGGSEVEEAKEDESVKDVKTESGSKGRGKGRKRAVKGQNRGKKEEQEKEGGEELKDLAEDAEEGKKSRKRGSSSPKEPVTPIDRPTRERKTVERYSEPSSERIVATKGVSIAKGSGTQLKDIPNVAFKMSKRKGDDNMQMLHTILFGKKAKIHSLKRNLSQFSGFVWVENEEKQRAKTKEKLDKCVKEKLLDFCDLLDIPVSKTTTKKEELSVKLLEFLESPHATTEVSLADKEQKGKKRRRTSMSAEKTSGSSKKQKSKQSRDVEQKRKISSKDEDEDEVEHADSRSGSEQDNDNDVEHMEGTDEEAGESDKGKELAKDQLEDSQKGSSKKKVKGSEVEPRVEKDAHGKSGSSPAKSKKNSSSLALKKGSSNDDKTSDSPSKTKELKSKKQKMDDKKSQKGQGASAKDKASGKKSPSKSKALEERVGKGKAVAKPKAEPSREEMHAAVSDILKQVDFNTATLSDIIRQLGTHFGMDLMHKKAVVKSIIEEVINNMTDEEEDDTDEGENSEEAGDDGEEDEKDNNA